MMRGGRLRDGLLAVHRTGFITLRSWLPRMSVVAFWFDGQPPLWQRGFNINRRHDVHNGRKNLPLADLSMRQLVPTAAKFIAIGLEFALRNESWWAGDNITMGEKSPGPLVDHPARCPLGVGIPG